jgi:hypothetical protein
MAKLKLRHKRDIKLAVQQIRVFLNKKRYHPRRNVILDMVVFGLVSKAVKVAQAGVCLVDTGFPEEAFGLSRTLVEIALSLRFITNRYSERRATPVCFLRCKMEDANDASVANFEESRRARAAEIFQERVGKADS